MRKCCMQIYKRVTLHNIRPPMNFFSFLIVFAVCCIAPLCIELAICVAAFFAERVVTRRSIWVMLLAVMLAFLHIWNKMSLEFEAMHVVLAEMHAENIELWRQLEICRNS